MAEKVDVYLRQFQSLQAERVDYDVKWQLVSDYILPRRDFTVTKRPNQLRPHRVTSSVATNSNTRMASMVLTYAIDTSRPFMLPNTQRGLATAGRPTELDDASINYLGDLSWNVFDHMLRPKAQLLLRQASMLKEFCAFGCGVIWTGRRRGFGPYYNGRPVQACWWAENEGGEIDTLYYKFMLPMYRVFERWPDGARQAWPDYDPQHNEQELTSILMACQPRQGGKAGAVPEAKPWAMVTIALDKNVIVEESGYDSFPYAVYRYDPMPGAAYAEGPGCQVLPDVMVLNHLMQAIENCASQKAQPAIAVPARMFGKRLDRRPSAINAYNPQGLGLMRADQAIIKLDMSGDPTDAIQVAKDLIVNIETGYFNDILQLRETGDMTAEEVNARTDMRLRGLASIVANYGAPMTSLADRSMEIMLEEGSIPPPPAMLAKAEVDWEYAGPLQIAQLRGNVQSALQLINARGLVFQQDQDAAAAVDLEETLRVIHASLGAQPRTLMSRQFVQQQRAARAHAAQQQADAAKLGAVAKAASDGGAGAKSAMDAISTFAGAGQAGQGGATFAPAAPLATPVAA